MSSSEPHKRTPQQKKSSFFSSVYNAVVKERRAIKHSGERISSVSDSEDEHKNNQVVPKGEETPFSIVELEQRFPGISMTPYPFTKEKTITMGL